MPPDHNAATIPSIGSSKPFRDISTISLANLSSQASTLFFMLILARSLPVETFGLYASNITLAAICSGISDFGTNSKWTITLSNGTLHPFSWVKLAARKLLITFSAGFVLTLFLGFFSIWWFGQAFCMAWTLLLHQTILIYLKVFNKNIFYSIMIGTEKLIAVSSLSLFLLLNPGNSGLYWLCLCAGTLATSVLGIVVIGRSLRGKSFSDLFLAVKDLARVNPWKGSLAFATSSLTAIMKNLDVPLVSVTVGPFAAGLYGSISKWFQPLYVSAGMTSTLITPWMASKAKLSRKNMLAAWSPTVATAFVSCIVAFCPAEVIAALLGPRYSGAAAFLPVLACATIVGAVNQILVASCQARGKEALAAVISTTLIVAQLGGGTLALLWFSLQGFLLLNLIVQLIGFGVLISAISSAKEQKPVPSKSFLGKK